MSTFEISKSSLLSLKAEILRKQQELIKVKADNEVKIKIIKKNTPLEIKNKGIDARKQNDLTEEEVDLLKQSKSILEAKSKLYDKLSSGNLTKEEIENNKRFLVRFDKKNKSVGKNIVPIDFEDSEPERDPASDDDHYHTDEDDIIKDPGEQWIDYTDCLGRTRKCLQKDLEYLKSKDEELKKTVEGKNKHVSSNEEKTADSENNPKKGATDDIPPENNQSKINEESELLSSDMRRELLRQQWEKEEDELRNKTSIHYQDILFGEARTHGVGYYGFSKDQEERVKQQHALKKLREETEAKQKKAQELKAIREKQLAARIKAAKDRRRARLGLPPEEDSEPVVPQQEISEEEKKKQEELKKQEEEKEKLLEEARKKHLRPWDIGKEGVKEHYEMSQEEWVEKKRDERPNEFAPPQKYISKEREFRSTVVNSHLRDVGKSLHFSTKSPTKKNHKDKKEGVRKQGMNSLRASGTSKTDISQQDPYTSGKEEPNDTNLRESHFEPTPIENLCDQSDFEDNLLLDYKNGMQDVPDKNEFCLDEASRMKRGRGVEIAPPSTFDYYGPSSSKKVKTTKKSVNIQDSIEAGLKFLRKQVEERQKTGKHRSDYTSPY